MTASQIIINSDDFGMSPGINRAVTRLHRIGRISGVSIVVNMSWSDEALLYAAQATGLRTGIHLNLSTGRPVSPVEQVASLLTPNGNFLELPVMLSRLVAGRVKKAEITAELMAQIERYLDRGVPLHHLDSHQHFHALPAFDELVNQVSRHYQVAAVRNPDFTAFVYPPRGPAQAMQVAIQKTGRRLMVSTQNALAKQMLAVQKPTPNSERLIYLRWCFREKRDPLDTFKSCFEVLEGQTLEIITHPAERDDVLPAISRYVDGRQREMAFLKSDEFGEMLNGMNMVKI